LVTNIGLFIILLRAERTKVTLTEGEQHWRKQIVTFFSCISNLLLAGAGLGLAGALGMRLSESRSLITPLVWAAIQVCVPSSLIPSPPLPPLPPPPPRGMSALLPRLEIPKTDTSATSRRLLSIATTLFDAVKNHRDGRDLLD
jgi:hypothetical protein